MPAPSSGAHYQSDAFDATLSDASGDPPFLTATRTKKMPRSPLVRLRKLCLALPDAHEVEAWGAPTFRVRNRMFAMYAAHGNSHGGRSAVWCKATHVNQALMVQASPGRFFVPPYMGPSGWVGVWLDGKPDWSEVASLLEDGYRLVAPRKLAAALDAG